MLPLILLLMAVLCSFVHLLMTRGTGKRNIARIFLLYIVFWNLGVMGLLAAFAHIFHAEEIAKQIGWQPGSPFQFEVAMGNLAFGVLGILSPMFRGRFLLATVIGYAIYFIGCFVGHLVQYQQGDVAPLNIGPFIWLSDLVIPLLTVFLLLYVNMTKKNEFSNEK